MESARIAMSLPTVALLLSLALARVRLAKSEQQGLALTPPRGWNSYDAFSWTISEAEFLDSARVLAEKLLPFGYDYAVVDFLWYRKYEEDVSYQSPGYDSVDKYGRPIPDLQRWPSSKDGKGFGPVAEQVHAMGLKFGLHVMRGISTAAIDSDCLILEAEGSPSDDQRPWTAGDIALPDQACSWMPECFVAVNTSLPAATAFFRSLYSQYASWGVDFVKHDCVFGVDNFLADEVAAVSAAIQETGRPIVYSLSPGTRATPSMAESVAALSNMYRVTDDGWDSWADLQTHFDVAKEFGVAGLIGAPGARGGGSWPDLDMLPFGWITDPNSSQGPHRFTQLSLEEQRTQMTLWAMARSPLIFGGDLRQLDEQTLQLLTNPVILEISENSTGNAELSRPDSNTRVWVAQKPPLEYFVALFNLGRTANTLSVTVQEVVDFFGCRRIPNAQCSVEDAWQKHDTTVVDASFSVHVASHATALFRMTCSHQPAITQCFLQDHVESTSQGSP